MTDTVSVRQLQHPDELCALAAECDRLAQRMRPRIPFATSGWLLKWWEHYQENRLLVRDHFFVHALHDEQGALVALAPLLLSERPGSGPFRSRGLSFFGGDKNVTELRGLVCAPESELAATRALLAHLLARSESWDWMVWNGVRSGSEASVLLNAIDDFKWTQQITDYVLPLVGTWEQFRASRSRNIKESLRKCYNSLRRDGHTFTFRVVSEPLAVQAALARFFELHARRSVAPGLVPHQDVFVSARSRRLLLDLTQSPRQEPSLCSFELEIAGRVVAARLGFVLGDELYLYFSGYDPAWAEYSVMTTTVAEAIKWAIENGFRAINLSPGTDVSKTRWGAQATTTCNGVLISPTARARLAFALHNRVLQQSGPDTVLGAIVARARRKA